jgi:NAD(P)-dependent dehydrogenase (short-subunit alcohol dehydrogenase family)
MRVAVVTGAMHGLGSAIAHALAARGYAVVVAGRDAEGADRAAAAIGAAHGGETLGLGCDVTQVGSVEAAWDAAVARFGQVDAWINNAGLALTGNPLATLPSIDFRTMLEVNMLGTMHGCQIAAAGMRDRGGAIYNILGAGSDGVPVPGMIGYGTTKRAVQFFTRQFAQEMAGTGVIVGALSPGLVITEGFLREHAHTPAQARAGREAVVNLIGDHPATVADWAARIVATNKRHGRVFNWLTPGKIARRRAAGPRDILSTYR